MTSKSVDWEYPKSLDDIDEEIEDQIKKEIQNERDPRIKSLLEKIDSSRDHYEIIALSSELIGVDPENFMGHLRKAVSYHRLKQDQKAEQSFKEAIKKVTTREPKIICFMGSLYFIGSILKKN